MKSKKDKKIFIILILILFISVGFAFLTSNLTIDGLAILKKSVFDVHFENLVDDSNGAELNRPAKISADGRQVNFEVTLDSPNDVYYFYVNVVNKSTMDVMLNNYFINGLSAEQEKYIETSLTYYDGISLNKYDLLEEQSSEKLKVEVKYRDFDSENDLPTSDLDFNLTLETEYIQADENGRKRQYQEDNIKPIIKFIKNNNLEKGKVWYQELSIDTKIIDNGTLKSTKYCITNAEDCTPSEDVELINNQFTHTFISSSDKQKLCVEAVDQSDNNTHACTDSYYVDTDKPIVNSLSVNQKDNSISISVTNTETASGVFKYYYSKDGGANYTASNKNNYTFTNLSPGTYNIAVYIEDIANNQSEIFNYESPINLISVFYDYNFNMLDELEDVENVKCPTGEYSIKNNVVIVTGRREHDGIVQTPYGAEFDKTKTYYISSTIDGVWGDKTIEGSQEIFLNNYKKINIDFVHIAKDYVEFKVGNSTRYNLRFDVNADGVTRTFSNIFISEYEKKFTQAGNTITYLPQLSNDFYTFDGWYKDKSYTEKVTKQTTLTENIRLYAKWTPNKVKIRYHLNGGEHTNPTDTITNDGDHILNNSNEDFEVFAFNEKINLQDYNNPSSINIEKVHFKAKTSEEWNTQDDGSGTSFDQSATYKASDLCLPIKNDCTVDLFVNWKQFEYLFHYKGSQNYDNYTLLGTTFIVNEEEYDSRVKREDDLWVTPGTIIEVVSQYGSKTIWHNYYNLEKPSGSCSDSSAEEHTGESFTFEMPSAPVNITITDCLGGSLRPILGSGPPLQFNFKKTI